MKENVRCPCNRRPPRAGSLPRPASFFLSEPRNEFRRTGHRAGRAAVGVLKDPNAIFRREDHLLQAEASKRSHDAPVRPTGRLKGTVERVDQRCRTHHHEGMKRSRRGNLVTRSAKWRAVSASLEIASHEIGYEGIRNEFEGHGAIFGDGGDPPLKEHFGELTISHVCLTAVEIAVGELTRHVAHDQVLYQRLDMRRILRVDGQHQRAEVVLAEYAPAGGYESKPVDVHRAHGWPDLLKAIWTHKRARLSGRPQKSQHGGRRQLMFGGNLRGR